MASEPASEQLPWAQCMAYEFEEEASVPAGAAGAPVYQSRRWKKNKIKVHFMNAVPSTWLLTEAPEKVLLTEEKVLEWANGWSNQVPCLKGVVPEFIMEEDIDASDVRIEFTEDGSKSMIGTDAKNFEGEATFSLDLAAADNDYREYTVLHEFGHVLGLGHEHQRSYIAGAVDKATVVDWLVRECHMDRSSADTKFYEDYMCRCPFGAGAPEICVGTKIDPWSVMCYPLALTCIRDKERFTCDELTAITSRDYQRRKRLSSIDVTTIQGLYSTANQRGNEVEVQADAVADIYVHNSSIGHHQ